MVTQWIELEDAYLTNQPIHHYEGRGKNKKPILDSSVEPTENYLFCYRATKMTQGRVRRKRFLHVLTGENGTELDEKLREFVQRKDVILISAIDDPGKYIQSGLEPNCLCL